MGNFLLQLFFYFFSSLSIISAFMVILSSNPVYSALFLVSVFFNSALLILLLDLEFLAIIFIIIYVGAIMVLFLFIIMMLDIKHITVYVNVYYYFFISGLVLMLFIIEFLGFLSIDLVTDIENGNIPWTYTNWFSLVVETSNLRSIGSYLYTYFSFFFIMAGVILLVAMIGAISLTLETTTDTKQQLLYKQVNTNPKDSLFYVK
jgi:NADH:ubiquinone oxidoreductase subunit 6 (subunit J)